MEATAHPDCLEIFMERLSGMAVDETPRRGSTSGVK
jgi:hypothetical protein